MKIFSANDNEIFCIAHLLLYKIMIYSFLSFPFWPVSGSETLLLYIASLSLLFIYCSYL